MNTQTLKAILFDADGVTIVPEETFAAQYARINGFDAKELAPFWQDFQAAMRGEADLKDILENHRKTWHLVGDTGELIEEWFRVENRPNIELIALVKELRKNGIKCYLATNQEKYRTAFIREQMFADVFDDIFPSAEIGAIKPSQDYFSAVLKTLASQGIGIENIAYFDDSPANVQAAQQIGISSYVYKNIDDVKNIL